MSQPDNASLSDGFPPFDDVLVKNTVYDNQENEGDDIENCREDSAVLSAIKVINKRQELCNSLDEVFFYLKVLMNKSPESMSY